MICKRIMMKFKERAYSGLNNHLKVCINMRFSDEKIAKNFLAHTPCLSGEERVLFVPERAFFIRLLL